MPTTAAFANPNLLDDMAALHRYATGADPRAFEVLVQRYLAMVLATCARTTRSRADAEDAAQETFLKLAQNAARIRSNAAAWLHSCAVRTSIDLIRRKGAQQRAEHRAAELNGAEMDGDATGPEAVQTWREIRPMVDAALLELSEDDRQLIVERFFAGRLEVEMARDAGVAAGTMNRRIDQAVGRLREKLRLAGLTAVGGVGAIGLTAALVFGGVAPAQCSLPGLSASLMSIGVAGVGQAPAAAVGTVGVAGLKVGVPMALAGLGVLAMAGLVAGGAMMFAGHGSAGGGGGGGSGALSAAGLVVVSGSAEGHGRPTKEEGPFRMAASMRDGRPGARLICDGPRIKTIEIRDGMAKPSSVVFVIESAEIEAGKGKLKLKVEAWEGPKPKADMEIVGMTMNATYTASGGELSIKTVVPWGDQDREITMNLRKVEDAAGQSIGAPGKATEKTVKPVDAPAPALLGTWDEVSDWQLNVSKDEIAMKSGNYEVARYKILEWTPGAEFAKVQTICVRNANATRIGERIKMLAKRTDGGWAFAMQEGEREKLNTWPSGFTPKPGELVRVMTFKGGK